MAWACSHCRSPLMSANEACSGHFLDTGHPANAPAMEVCDTPGCAREPDHDGPCRDARQASSERERRADG